MDMQRDLKVFTNPKYFGQSVTIGGTPVNVIFDSSYVAVDAAGIAAESSSPAIIGRDSDLSGYSHDAAVVVAGVNYKIVERQPDGTGMTTIILRRG